MTTEIFTRNLIQTVSDWRRGGSHDQKVKRGDHLKTAVALLPEHSWTCAFRQEAREKDRVWQLLATIICRKPSPPGRPTSPSQEHSRAACPRRVCKASYSRSRFRRTAWFLIWSAILPLWTRRKSLDALLPVL